MNVLSASGDGGTSPGKSWVNMASVDPESDPSDLGVAMSRRRHTMRKFLCVTLPGAILFSLLTPMQALADPSISRTSPQFVTHALQLTISGSGFGTHADFHPDPDKLVRMWETFETGDFSSNPYGKWEQFNPPALELIKNSPTAREAAGDTWAYRRNNTGLGNIIIPGQAHGEYWISYWTRFSPSWDLTCGSGGQWKGTRITSSNNKVNVYPGWGIDDGFHWGLEFVNPFINVWKTQFMPQHDPPSNQPSTSWQRWDEYIKKASSSNANDGKLMLRVDNVLVYDYATVTGPKLGINDFDDEGGDFAKSIAIGSYFKRACSGVYVEYDDIYISHTQARVEICNASSFSKSTHCEIQVPISWSDSSITLIANQGSLSASDMYLYVVDRTGRTNDSGYRLTTFDKTPPQAPTGLNIK